MLLLLASWLLYSFDPWLGVLIAVLLVAVGLVLMLTVIWEQRIDRQDPPGEVPQHWDEDHKA
jgi:hypothetical protein